MWKSVSFAVLARHAEKVHKVKLMRICGIEVKWTKASDGLNFFGIFAGTLLYNGVMRFILPVQDSSAVRTQMM